MSSTLSCSVERAELRCVWHSDWIRWHPYGMPPSKLRSLVCDDAEPEEAPNVILDDPRVKEQLGNAMEIPGGMGMFGTTVIHFG